MDTAHAQSLKKFEILRGGLRVSGLFSSAHSFRGKFIKAFFAPIEIEHAVNRSLPKVLFVVGKKTMPSAVDRNRTKRLMKEAYRQEKSIAAECAAQHTGKGGNSILCIAFMYIGRYKTLPSSESFRKEIRELLQGIKSMNPG